jgi:spore coat protein CotH
MRQPLLLLLLLGTLTASAGAPPKSAAELYQPTKVYSAHFTFTPDQWEAMEPKGGGPGFFGRGGPGGPGGRGGFGPGMFLAPAFLEQGDTGKDGKLSKEEFGKLGEKWFTEWDKEKAGKLKTDQIAAGLNATLPGPGGPGGGRGGPGFSLQGREGSRNGLSAAQGITFEYVHADLEFEGQRFTNVAVRYKGNGTFMQSRGSLKRSLKVDLNKFVKGQKLAGVSTLNFHNCVTDASWMNEALSHRLFRDAGVPAARTAYARVFVTVPGKFDRQYFGLYSLVENLDSNFAKDNFRSRKGALFKPVTRQPFEYLGDDWAKYSQIYDPKTDVTAQQTQRVIDFCKLVSQADDAEFAARLSEFIDLDNFARFMAATVWVCTLDSILSIGQNYVVHLHPQTQKFQFMPWDLDHSFGQFFLVGDQETREQLGIHKPWQGEIRFLERVFKVEAFKRLYLARLEELSKSVFKPERFHQQVDEIAVAIRDAVKEESEEQLARFDKVVAGEAVEPARFGGFGGNRPPPPGGPATSGEQPRPPAGEGGGPPRFGGGFGGFMRPIKPIKPFVTARAQSVNDQLAGKAEGKELAFGFGGPGGRGGRGGPGGPGGFGPGSFLARGFLSALDADKNSEVTKAEFTEGFNQWFANWDTDKGGALTEEKLREGINKDLAPLRGGPPE